MKLTEGITEAMKEANPMRWVQHMNSIRNRAEVIILQELIYGEGMAGISWKISGIAISIRQNMILLPVRNTKELLQLISRNEELFSRYNVHDNECVIHHHEHSYTAVNTGICIFVAYC